MIIVDANVPVYSVGAHHPDKTRAMELVDGLIRGGDRLVTDVVVHREILHGTPMA